MEEPFEGEGADVEEAEGVGGRLAQDLALADQAFSRDLGETFTMADITIYTKAQKMLARERNFIFHPNTRFSKCI